jgi:hypothetical protein
MADPECKLLTVQRKSSPLTYYCSDFLGVASAGLDANVSNKTEVETNVQITTDFSKYNVLILHVHSGPCLQCPFTSSDGRSIKLYLQKCATSSHTFWRTLLLRQVIHGRGSRTILGPNCQTRQTLSCPYCALSSCTF